MAQRRNAQTAPTAPRQSTREGEALRADVRLMHRQLQAGAFAMNGQDIDIHFDAAGTATVPHRLGKTPSGIVTILTPSAAQPAFNIDAWDKDGLVITAAAGCTFKIRVYG